VVERLAAARAVARLDAMLGGPPRLIGDVVGSGPEELDSLADGLQLGGEIAGAKRGGFQQDLPIRVRSQEGWTVPWSTIWTFKRAGSKARFPYFSSTRPSNPRNAWAAPTSSLHTIAVVRRH
jgi:hypothetical protein